MPFCNKCGMRIQTGRLCDVCVKDEQLAGHGWDDVVTDGGLSTRLFLDAIDRYRHRAEQGHEPGSEFWERHVEQMQIGLSEHGREVRGEVVD